MWYFCCVRKRMYQFSKVFSDFQNLKRTDYLWLFCCKEKHVCSTCMPIYSVITVNLGILKTIRDMKPVKLQKSLAFLKTTMNNF